MNENGDTQDYVYYIELARSYKENLSNEELRWRPYKRFKKKSFILSPEELTDFTKNLATKLNHVDCESIENGFINKFIPKHHYRRNVYVRVQNVPSKKYEEITGNIVKNKLTGIKLKLKPGK